MDTVNKQITDIKITDIKLKKDGSTYLLDVELDCENNKAYIEISYYATRIRYYIT